jgi:hypothetical protein
MRIQGYILNLTFPEPQKEVLTTLFPHCSLQSSDTAKQVRQLAMRFWTRPGKDRSQPRHSHEPPTRLDAVQFVLLNPACHPLFCARKHKCSTVEDNSCFR